MNAPSQALGGPVSAALETSLRDRVRQQGVVLWLDVSDDYSGFADRLSAERAAGRLPYEVCRFRGSYLELMLQLEGLAGGVEKSQLVVHLPGLTEESIQGTPVLELYRAGVRYRKKLVTLIREAAGGRVRRERIDAYVARADLSLEDADAWLAALLQDGEGGLSAQLRAMRLPAVVDDLLAGGFVAGRLRSPDDVSVLWERLDAWTGLHDSWRAASGTASGPGEPIGADDVAFAVAGWALCVEYVDDLVQDPQSPLLSPAMGLPASVVTACKELAVHLRQRHPAFYQTTADQTEEMLGNEVDHADAEELGDIDTFRFEDERVLDAALVALEDEHWSRAARWAGLRVGGDSFWLEEDPLRRSAWQLVESAAALGLAIKLAGARLGRGADLATAVACYVDRGAPVDRAHRQLEQRILDLLYPRLDRFEVLRARMDALRDHWRDWADSWAREFNAACAQHGFLPEPGLQQRTLFEEVVRPLVLEGRTAYFVVDALRFEMAQELYQALQDTPATTVRLEPRLAELPTVTEVGMNVLAPVVAAGKLRPSLSKGKIKGFSTGEYRVAGPESRKRAMHQRVGGGTCPWLTLAEVLGRDPSALNRTVARAKLVVVHSTEIDDAGEKGAGPDVFETVLQKLRAAWRLLRDAGVRRFVITSDHGFLMLDERSHAAHSHGRKIDPKRRHVFSTVAADHSGEVRVPLIQLRYEGVEGHVMFPEDAAVFDTGKRSVRFVHGGNSLQERVIPVLTLVHRAASGASTVSYGVQARALEGIGGMHSVTGLVRMSAQVELGFGGPREVELGLRVVDMEGVRVELCHTRGSARIAGAAVLATVDEEFELFFRLTGHTDARVLVEFGHSSAAVNVSPCVIDARFAVSAGRAAAPPSSSPAQPASTGRPWLDDLPGGGVRELFEQLSTHGAVTESEAVAMLGSPRKHRRFNVRFETYAAKAPFSVRIDVVSGVKRYVREGASS